MLTRPAVEVGEDEHLTRDADEVKVASVVVLLDDSDRPVLVGDEHDLTADARIDR
jgi:hypothetical protein